MSVQNEDLRAQLSAARADLAAARAQLAAPHVRAAVRGAELLRQADPLRRARLDDVLQYVARTGGRVASDAAPALGACRDFWRNDQQMHWAVAKARYGPHKMTRLMWASQRGRSERVAELVAWGSEVNAQDARGLAPLHFAAITGGLGAARELLARGAKLEARDDLSAMTALHHASFMGFVEIARLLLSKGARVDALERDDDASPLYLASQQGHAEVVRELLARGAAEGLRVRDGNTALHKAAGSGHAAVVRNLLAAGADVGARNGHNATPLHMAADMDRAEELRLLLRAPGADVEAINDLSRTPLIVACMFGYISAATVLVGAGASLAPRSNNGFSALGWAQRRVWQDEEGLSDEGGDEPPTAAQKKAHKALVAMLQALGAPP